MFLYNLPEQQFNTYWQMLLNINGK